jgi:acetoin utilization deacetylase AcuC-like enzyme
MYMGMTRDTLEQERARYKAMTVEQASAEISKAVYAATAIMEKLEAAGHLKGNGHHARQKLATAAAEDLKSRWK